MPGSKELTGMKNGKSAGKLVYKLEEISRLAKLDSKTIDAWEKEFPFLQPGQTAGGRKIFRQKDLDIILRIKELLDKEGCTLAGAKRRIEEEFGLKTPVTLHPDKLKKALWQVREELQEIVQTLKKNI
ncbi:MAG: MerR family transcriptional regulator [Candidatus Aminicenantales bacterium]